MISFSFRTTRHATVGYQVPLIVFGATTTVLLSVVVSNGFVITFVQDVITNSNNRYLISFVD